MTAPLRDQVAEVLAEHEFGQLRDAQGLTRLGWLCTCGASYALSDVGRLQHPHAHLADVITALVEQREREVRAEALEEVAEDWIARDDLTQRGTEWRRFGGRLRDRARAERGGE